jgi:signal transduction histidine kinase
VARILNNSIDHLKQTFQNRDIKINNTLPKKGVTVKGNELLRDVFDNILENAIKYNKEEKIMLDITHSGSKNNKFWKFEIQDNGPGVPDEMKERIFERLQRGEKSVHGSGLGLTIVKEIITRYGGEIMVQDKVKGDYTHGSNFVIILPKGDA